MDQGQVQKRVAESACQRKIADGGAKRTENNRKSQVGITVASPFPASSSPMVLSTSKKVAAARAKPMGTKKGLRRFSRYPETHKLKRVKPSISNP